jgi:hypothetical protein
MIFTCLLTRTFFIIQTWSKLLIFILILNQIFSIINRFLYNYPKLKYILVIIIPLLSFSTLIIYLIYMLNIYYRLMNILTINIMTNNRNDSLLSDTLKYYKCCRIQDEILFDSVDERDYFTLFPHCEKIIRDNESNKDQWNYIITCAEIFKSIVFYTRLYFIVDLILSFIIMFANLFYICEENDQCFQARTDNKLNKSF